MIQLCQTARRKSDVQLERTTDNRQGMTRSQSPETCKYIYDTYQIVSCKKIRYTCLIMICICSELMDKNCLIDDQGDNIPIGYNPLGVLLPRGIEVSAVFRENEG